VEKRSAFHQPVVPKLVDYAFAHPRDQSAILLPDPQLLQHKGLELGGFAIAAEAAGLRIVSGLVLSDRGLLPELHQTPETAYRDSVELIRRFHGKGRTLYAVTPRFAISLSISSCWNARRYCGRREETPRRKKDCPHPHTGSVVTFGMGGQGGPYQPAAAD